jgi:hypothetical protein
MFASWEGRLQTGHKNVVDVTVKFIGSEGKATQEKAVALATWLRSPGLFLKGPLQMERAKGRKIWAVFERWARVTDSFD